MRKLNLISLAFKAEQKHRNFTSLEVLAEIKCGSGLTPKFQVLAEQVRKMNEIFRSPGRAEVRKAELHIFKSPGRDEMQKWTYPYLDVLAEQVRTLNKIFEVMAEWKYGKRNSRSLAEKTERKCGNDALDL